MRQAFRSCDFGPANSISESLDGFRYGIHPRLLSMPSGSLDPQGIHGAIWNEIDPSAPFHFPDHRKMTAVSYHAIVPPVAYVEPIAVGLPLPVMPLFLDGNRYLNLPLEPSYNAAFGAIPRHYRQRLSQSIPQRN